jgi:hypothetical protein
MYEEALHAASSTSTPISPLCGAHCVLKEDSGGQVSGITIISSMGNVQLSKFMKSCF